MKPNILFFASVMLSSLAAISQQFPIGTCGIVYVHDEAGCRTRRVYFCNNGVDPWPTRQPTNVLFAKGETAEFLKVDALYPNPTTGRFSVTFSKPLSNANVSVTDLQGKSMLRFNASGNKVDFDLSGVAAGVYLVRVEEKGRAITKKVIKQ